MQASTACHRNFDAWLDEIDACTVERWHVDGYHNGAAEVNVELVG